MVSALWQDLQVRELMAAGQERGVEKMEGRGAGMMQPFVRCTANLRVASPGGQRK